MLSRRPSLCVFAFVALLSLSTAIGRAADEGSHVPYLLQWGIYEMDLETREVALIYTSSEKLVGVHLNGAGDTFAFSQGFGGSGYEHEEICTLNMDGTGFTRLTDNGYLDTYPIWSPEGDRIAFLSMPGETLDIYVMDPDGSGRELLYDSGFHDADIDWTGDRIAFTRNSQIWIMDDDGSDARQVTDPPRAGEWGNAVLPFGDYDPRISPDGCRIVFERMVDDSSAHGNYDLYSVNMDGSGETALTDTGWTQGLVSWSPSGERMAFIVSAVGSEGRYDIHLMDADGGNRGDLTSDVFPLGFLAHCVTFTSEETIVFVGEWWGWKVLEASLSCAPEAEAVEAGEEVTVSGRLSPVVPGAAVVLTYIDPDGNENIRNTSTDRDGAYSDSFRPDGEGAWKVGASWEGDQGHHPAASAQQAFTVREAELSGGGGIPGFPIEAVALGLLLSVTYALMKAE